MMEVHESRNKPPTLRELYPHLTDEQLKEAEETLDQYVAFCLRVYERIKADPQAYAQLQALTAARRADTMKSERSNRISTTE